MTNRQRSPSYPYLDLEAVVEKTKELVSRTGRGPFTRESALRSLGVSPSSGSGGRTMASLLAFGLWESSGSGQIRLSDRGRRIVQAPSLDAARVELREAARVPEIHQRILAQWPDGLPESDEGMLTLLRMEWDFNPEAVNRFIREVRSTFAFAGVYDGASVSNRPAEQWVDGRAETQPMTPSPAGAVAEAPLGGVALSGPGPVLAFPLPGGNMVEIRLRSKVSPKVFETIKKLIDLAEESFVEE